MYKRCSAWLTNLPPVMQHFRHTGKQSLDERPTADALDEALMPSVRYTQKDPKGDPDIYLLGGPTD